MRKHLPTRLLALLTALSLSLLFTACGASSKGQSLESAMDAEAEEVIYENTAAEAPADKANSMLSDPLSQASMPDGLNLKLIWRANLSMETLKFDKTLQQVSALVSELGGFIESSSSSGGSDASGNYINQYASITARIPSKDLNGFISRLNDCGTITNQRLSSENISLEYADTEARKQALQTEYDRLLELMAQAENIDTVIAIEARLSEVRLQLDSLSSQLRTYDNLVDYSTVYLDVQEVRNLSGTNATTIPERISNGLSNTLYGIKVFFENLLVFLVVNLPVFLLLAVVILLIIWVLRLIRHKRSQKNEPIPSAAPPKSDDEPVDSPDKNNR